MNTHIVDQCPHIFQPPRYCVDVYFRRNLYGLGVSTNTLFPDPLLMGWNCFVYSRTTQRWRTHSIGTDKDMSQLHPKLYKQVCGIRFKLAHLCWFVVRVYF